MATSMDWDLFWGIMLALFVWIPLLLIWLFAIVDLFGRQDIGGFAKALWLLAILFLPILGTLLYYLFRPAVPASYMRYDSGSERDATLADLHQRGVISADQYETERSISRAGA